MTGKLAERKLVAKETFEMTFSLTQKVSFSPGQYVTISIPHPKHEDYQMNERIFSLVNSPTQSDIAKILFRYRDSGFKNNLLEMEMGGEVKIAQPIGLFELPQDESVPVVFLATGVGIAPFISKLSFLREQKSQRHIWLFFSNYSRETAPYLDFLKDTKKDLVNLNVYLIMTRDENWLGERERISIKIVRKYFPKFAQANFFLAGLPEFVNDLVSQLIGVGVPKRKILQESFDGY